MQGSEGFLPTPSSWLELIKLPKIKEERILKAARRKERVTFKGVPIKLPDDFSKASLKARRGWKEVFKVIKGKDQLPR